MSLVTLRQNRQASTEVLLQRLTEEFLHPADEYAAPFISIDRPGASTHLLVVWDEWRNLSQQERSQLVMEAYEAARGEASALDVSVAMGLTQDEATLLGIDFEPAPS